MLLRHFPGKVLVFQCLCLLPPAPDLVEKQPCSFNSSRTCECRPGLFCQTTVKDTCTRCQHHSACKPGFGVKIRGRSSFPGPGNRPGPDAFYCSVLSNFFFFYSGTSTNDVTCEECPPGTFSDQNSSTDICKPHTK